MIPPAPTPRFQRLTRILAVLGALPTLIVAAFGFDKHIVSLRQKIETDPSDPRWIHTVHGTGYRLDGVPRRT